MLEMYLSLGVALLISFVINLFVICVFGAVSSLIITIICHSLSLSLSHTFKQYNRVCTPSLIHQILLTLVLLMALVF